MNGDEFIRRVRKLAKKQGYHCDVTTQGKGSHRTHEYGDKRTTVKHGEIGKGLLSAMMRQLGLRKDDFF